MEPEKNFFSGLKSSAALKANSKARSKSQIPNLTTPMSSSGLGLSEIFPEGSELESELAGLTTEQIKARTKNEESNAKFNQRQISSLEQEIREAKLEVKDNMDKIKANIVLPYLVANVVEVRVCPGWVA